ncbi:MAG: hypothetical protein ABI972_17720 [Acidobacteriota bacterium]
MILALLLAAAALEPLVRLPSPSRPTLIIELRDPANPNLRYSIARVPAPADCMLRLERATATDTVLACAGEKGAIHPNLKFVYDPRSKALVKHFTYMPFAFTGAHFIASNGDRALRVIVAPTPEPSFRIEAAAHLPRPDPPARYTQPSGLPPLRQPTYDEFARARPDRVANGYTRTVTAVEEIIGPRVKEDNLLWFGKSFYDGEGHTGVGGFGFYDYAARRYTTYSPPEIVPYSVSAIAVSPQHVWFGLVHNGEWGSSGAGLLCFDRATQQVHRFESTDIANAILIEGARTIAATNFGITIVEANRQRRFFVDQTSDGRLRMAEAVH